jgi:hypothetical protein
MVYLFSGHLKTKLKFVLSSDIFKNPWVHPWIKRRIIEKRKKRNIRKREREEKNLQKVSHEDRDENL